MQTAISHPKPQVLPGVQQTATEQQDCRTAATDPGSTHPGTLSKLRDHTLLRAHLGAACVLVQHESKVPQLAIVFQQLSNLQQQADTAVGCQLQAWPTLDRCSDPPAGHLLHPVAAAAAAAFQLTGSVHTLLTVDPLPVVRQLNNRLKLNNRLMTGCPKKCTRTLHKS